MAFPSDFLDELRRRVPLSGVVGRRVRLIKKGREFTGLCPFHSEKSPSFFVNDDKAFYHCFGCGAHGDALSFLINADGMTFVDAVERLADEAGLPVPKSAPVDPKARERRKTLEDAMEAACRFFEDTLRQPAGRDALAYLKRRGFSEADIATFRLGAAPEGRGLLKQALIARGFAEDMLIEAGLLIQPEDGGRDSYDRFRGRVMFPILDRRGHVIAFGGRILGDGEPKYLNSPETPLFHKGRTLYAHHLARVAAAKNQDVIVAEGYVDVIALHRAGFAGAVAPLGTALTEDQLGELWRMAAEPILCLDGDAAGQRAMARAAERALPLLKPGKSLRFLILPQSMDPDDLLKHAQGTQYLKQCIAHHTTHLPELLWGIIMETCARYYKHQNPDSFLLGMIRNYKNFSRDTTEKFTKTVLNITEREVFLKEIIKEETSKIKDNEIRNAYIAFFRNLCAERLEDREDKRGIDQRIFKGIYISGYHRGFRDKSKGGKNVASTRAERAFKRFADYGNLADLDPGQIKGVPDRSTISKVDKQRLIARQLLCAILNHPMVLEEFLERLADISFADAGLDSLRREIVHSGAALSSPDTASLRHCLDEKGFGPHISESLGAARLARWCRADADLATVRAGLSGLLDGLMAARLSEEKARLHRELVENPSAEASARFMALVRSGKDQPGEG